MVLKVDGIDASHFCSLAGGSGLLPVRVGCLQQRCCCRAKVPGAWPVGCSEVLAV